MIDERFSAAALAALLFFSTATVVFTMMLCGACNVHYIILLCGGDSGLLLGTQYHTSCIVKSWTIR